MACGSRPCSCRQSHEDLPDGAGLEAYGYLEQLAPWKSQASTLVWTVAAKNGPADESVTNFTAFARDIEGFILGLAAHDPPVLRAVRIETPWRTTQAVPDAVFNKTGIYAADWRPHTVNGSTAVNHSTACPANLCRHRTACPGCYFSADNSTAVFVVKALHPCAAPQVV